MPHSSFPTDLAAVCPSPIAGARRSDRAQARRILRLYRVRSVQVKP